MHMQQLKQHEVRLLTNETVHFLGVAGIVWDSETTVTDSHLALTEWQREEAQLIEQTTHSLETHITVQM